MPSECACASLDAGALRPKYSSGSNSSVDALPRNVAPAQCSCQQHESTGAHTQTKQKLLQLLTTFHFGHAVAQSSIAKPANGAVCTAAGWGRQRHQVWKPAIYAILFISECSIFSARRASSRRSSWPCLRCGGGRQSLRNLYQPACYQGVSQKASRHGKQTQTLNNSFSKSAAAM